MLPRWLPILFICSSFTSLSQTIGSFNSVQPAAQTQSLVLPATHSFQRLLRSNSTLTSGETVGINLDFAGYVPLSGSSTNGLLSVSSERAFASVAVVGLSFNNATKTWTLGAGGNVSFPFADLGFVNAFCAGTVLPNGHVMVCEETMAAGDYNNDGYNDDGWIIEIDPATRTVVNQDAAGGPDKIWAMGRHQHEDVAVTPDQAVVYWSADNSSSGFVYKFVPSVPGNFASGSLYVLKTTSVLGSGTWEPVANTSVSDRNNAAGLGTAAGGYNFSRVEGIEIGRDGKVYFAATTSGRIYRFRDLGTTVDQLEVFVESSDYDVDGAGPFPPEPWGTGADNIAFDGEGNLWVLQDGGRNHIWVVSPEHTAANPKVRLFATTPAGSEPTGITFTPDYKYLFLSIQHPSATNTTAQPDAAGNAVVFDESTTIVIARKENLGAVLLPISLVTFDAQRRGAAIELVWTTASPTTNMFRIERSANGNLFQPVGSVRQPGASHFLFTDANLPPAGKLQYRLVQTDEVGKTALSEIRTVQLQSGADDVVLFPTPAKEKLSIRLPASAGTATIFIRNAAGLLLRTIKGTPGYSQILLADFPPGLYLLTVDGHNFNRTLPFLKQ